VNGCGSLHDDTNTHLLGRGGLARGSTPHSPPWGWRLLCQPETPVEHTSQNKSGSNIAAGAQQGSNTMHAGLCRDTANDRECTKCGVVPSLLQPAGNGSMSEGQCRGTSSETRYSRACVKRGVVLSPASISGERQHLYRSERGKGTESVLHATHRCGCRHRGRDVQPGGGSRRWGGVGMALTSRRRVQGCPCPRPGRLGQQRMQVRVPTPVGSLREQHKHTTG
jgi:hypothetical protein